MADIAPGGVLNPWPDHGRGITIATIVSTVLATFGVALRFWARANQKATFRSDDYTILIALFLGWVLCILTTIATENALGEHIGSISPGSEIMFRQISFAIKPIWMTSMLLTKVSILLLYTRIFGSLRYFRIVAQMMGAFLVLWSSSTVVFVCLQCRPIQLIWDQSILGSCASSIVFHLVSSIPDAVTDIGILVLPLPAIWRLHTTVSQKMILTGIFFLGSW